MSQFNTIYQTTNLTNQKDYWGAHETDDLDDDYLGSGEHLGHSIRKYGKTNFNKLVTGVFKCKKIMYWVERMIVDQEMVDSDNYNKKLGGDGGWDYVNTPEIQKKAKENHKKKIDSMTVDEKSKSFGRQTSNNGTAIQVNIYNNQNEIVFETHGNFKKICKDNKLPFETLKKSYQSDSKIKLYEDMRACDLARMMNSYKDRYDKYKGWYAKIV